MGIKSFMLGVTFAAPVSALIATAIEKASNPQLYKDAIDTIGEKAVEHGPTIIEKASEHAPNVLDKLGL